MIEFVTEEDQREAVIEFVTKDEEEEHTMVQEETIDLITMLQEDIIDITILQ